MFSSAALPHALASLIILTTIQAQDFYDASGDAERGRRTLPLVLPRCGRVFTALVIPAWALGLIAYCRPAQVVAVPFVALGTFVGARFLCYTTEASDRLTFMYYNVSSISGWSVAILTSYC